MGYVTEYVGFPGTGKTQFCFQLCINVSLPERGWRGLAGEAVYIDTQSNFDIGRIHEMAEATIKRMKEQDPNLDHTVQKMLESIHVFHASSRKELSRLVNLIPALCQRFPKIRLVVIDSIVFHLRHDYSESRLKDRAKIVAQIARTLKRHATNLKIAVVTTNHLTSKKKESGKMEPEASLGRALSDYVDVRLLCYMIGDNQRWITPLISERFNRDDEIHIPFTIRDLGVRGQA